ncbi:MAG: hypothetical protein ACK5L2_04370 [Planctomyces sp.]|jgi:hypothetical protein
MRMTDPSGPVGFAQHSWTHLTAYRLAHLKCRATLPDRDELKRIDALFAS